MNSFNLDKLSDISIIASPTTSCVSPPDATCLAIALAPFKWTNGYLKRSPSPFSTKIAEMLREREPRDSSFTGARCFKIIRTFSNVCLLVFDEPDNGPMPSLTWSVMVCS